MKKIVILITLLLLTGCAGSMKNGVELLEAGKYDAAVEVFQKDIKKKRNLDEAYRGLGIAYFELEDYEAAVEAFELALEHETKETAVFCSFLGASYLETEDYDKALDVYERGLACKDLTEELEQEIQFNLIAVYERMGNWDAAKKQMDKYVKKYPNDSRVEKEAEFLETR
ncbi:MAG: tetratricopeptide repeat protein [Tyzzerella sp.]|nr:tetratricopeptide repeat protein [Tyzzerella sp.]